MKKEKEWSVCGSSASSSGRLDLGPWIQRYYGEFDGRRRRVLAKIIGEYREGTQMSADWR